MNCTLCGKEPKVSRSQWWMLKNYFGITGTFCTTCYDRVAHDSNWKPRHPKQYADALVKIKDARDEPAHN